MVSEKKESIINRWKSPIQRLKAIGDEWTAVVYAFMEN